MIFTSTTPTTPPRTWSIISSSSSKSTTLLNRLSTVAPSNLTTWISSFSTSLDNLVSKLPLPVQSFVSKHVTSWPGHPRPPPSPLVALTSLVLKDYPAAFYTTLAATLIVLIYYAFSMSSYGRSNGFWPRGSPYPSHPEDRPVNDYVQYINPDYLDRPEYIPYEHRPSIGRQHEYDDGEGPDVIHLRHMNHQHQLRFEPFAISDGLLSIRDIRERAARKIGVREAAQIRLLYKGTQLRDDKRSAKAYGLKQNSELMVVVSEAPPSRPNSDSETEGSGSVLSHGSKKGREKTRRGEVRYHSDHLSPASPEQDSHVSRRNSMRRDRRNDRQPSPHPHAQPEPRSPPPILTQSPPTSPPLPSPRNDAARAKLESLTSTFHTQWVPKCVQFLMNPPADPKMRETEHKKLSESILAQILLQVDEITTGDDLEARGARKQLVSEINEMFRKLDMAKEDFPS